MTSDILAEHGLAQALRPSDLDAFKAEGIPITAMSWTGCGQLSITARDRVAFGTGNRFEFARYAPHDAALVNAYVVPLLDEVGDVADIMAFRPGGPAAVWLGRVSMAGQEQVLRPRFDLGNALDVHSDVMAWLRSGRRGIVVLNFCRAADHLVGHTLRVTDPEHAQRLRVALTRPAPRVITVVRNLVGNVHEVAA